MHTAVYLAGLIACLHQIQTEADQAPGKPPDAPAADVQRTSNSPPVVAPPMTEKHPAIDSYHGVDVKDDYRWLEDGADPRVRSWSDAQNVRARKYLDGVPFAAAIRDRLTTLERDASVAYSRLEPRGAATFALKHQPTKQQPAIVLLPSLVDTSGERVLVDPNLLDPEGGTSIDWFVPSRDGRLLAVSLSESGSESGALHVYQVDSGAELMADAVPRVNGGTAGGSMAWNADGSGFYYTRYPRGDERPEEDLDFYQQVYFHLLGSPTESDRYELGRDFPRIAEIQLHSSHDGQWLLASVQNGDGGEFAHYVRSATSDWRQVADYKDQVVGAVLGQDGGLYLVSNQDAPRGKVLRVSLDSPTLSEATLVAAETEATVVADFWSPRTILPTEHHIYILEQVGGPNQVRVLDRRKNSSSLLPLPPISSVNQMLPGDGDDVLLHVETFLTPPAWYRYRAATGELVKTALAQTSPADYSDCEVVREFAVSRDGTRVPLNIIRRKGTKLDGRNPTILNGYGGYGVSLSPAFSAQRRIFLEQGGVYAIANLRGGGEFGESWHRAGNLTHKQNVFDDFHAAARHLIEAGYTSREHLAILGGSNGGLLMGATLTQHPELCRAVVSLVGIYDMLRVELSPNGAFNVTEFGTVKDPEQFRALLAYSPYQHVRDGVPYPAVLFITGANDPRVDPLHSRKMTARLQAASPGTLTLLRTDANAGHGIGSSLSERIEKGVDIYAFVFQQLGVDYQALAPAAKAAGTD